MKPDLDAYRVEAERLNKAFFAALDLCALHLEQAAALPYGDERARLLAASRAEVNEARTALKERCAHSATLRSLTEDETTMLAAGREAVDRLVALLDELKPSLEA